MTAADGGTFIDRLKALRAADTPTADPLDPPASVQGDGYERQARIYCAKALDRIAVDVASTPEGSRNQVLNDNALRAFRWVLAGHLDRQDTADRLQQAGLQAGLDPAEIVGTLRSAWRGAVQKGPAHPDVNLPAGPTAPPAGVNVETGEVIDLEAVMVEAKLRELRVLAKARQLLRDEEHAAAFRPPAYCRTLTEELLIPDEPEQYAIDGLLPAGGNGLLTAMFKAGKSTLCVNLLRAFADGTPFLGRFKVNPAPGRIAIFNYELSAGQFRAWLREAGIRNTDAVAVLNLRGYAMPITAPAIQEWIVQWLIEQDVSMWIADPFARAAVGTDENSNTEVGVWLDTFDVIKERANVRDGILPVHTGRAEQEAGQERARGATRLDDWADVRWLLNKNEEGQTFFRATGRDVEVAEEALEYDPVSRTLTMRGGDRAWVARRALERAVWQYVTDHPGLGAAAIRAAVEGNNNRIDQALATLVSSHHLRVDDAPGKLRPYVPTGKAFDL